MDELSEARFLDFAATDAGSTNAQTLARTIYEGVNGLEIQIPAALGNVVGVTDTMPELRTTAADFTNFCHFLRGADASGSVSRAGRSSTNLT